MSLFGSLMGDVEDDPFFGSHMRHMRQMNNMMNSLFSDPFGMLGGGLGGGPLAIGGPRHGGHGGTSLMPFMPQMPSLNRLFTDLDHMNAGSSFSSSTVVMSSGPNGKPQVYSSSSSTKIGPNGIKETKKTLQDSRTGTKKMSIGHHIGERGHVIERSQNLYSGDAEESQEFINIEEDEAEDFDREFQHKVGGPGHSRRAPPRLALPPAPAAHSAGSPPRRPRPAPRRGLRAAASPLATSSGSPGVREVYGSSHPRRKHAHTHRHSPTHTHTHANDTQH